MEIRTAVLLLFAGLLLQPEMLWSQASMADSLLAMQTAFFTPDRTEEASFSAVPPQHEEESSQSLWKRDALTGEWKGYRSRFAPRGVELEAIYTGESWLNASGGIERRGSHLHNIVSRGTAFGLRVSKLVACLRQTERMTLFLVPLARSCALHDRPITL